MKEFICGALSAFSAIAAYHLCKTFLNKKETVFKEEPIHNNIERDIVPNKDIGHLKLVSFNKDAVDERRGILAPSGFELLFTHDKSRAFFDNDIENVLNNTDNKIVILDICKSNFITALKLKSEYTDISEEYLKEDILEKYSISNDGINIEPCNISPLTERITFYNIERPDDMVSALKYVFTQAWHTFRLEHKRVWLYIPESIVSGKYYADLLKIMQKSRTAGVIITAAVSIDDLTFNDTVRSMVNNCDYIAITGSIEEYNEYYSTYPDIRDLIDHCIYKIFQFDIKE
jgi:hypothetical protein